MAGTVRVLSPNIRLDATASTSPSMMVWRSRVTTSRALAGGGGDRGLVQRFDRWGPG
jgi:hypothetical protein